MIEPDDRERLCEALVKLCKEFGSDEVQKALNNVIDAVEQDTEEIDFDSAGGEELEERNL